MNKSQGQELISNHD